jgi:DNA-binding NtrC family response regulator
MKNGKTRRVLVVDDDADLAGFTAQTLVFFGAVDEACTVPSGEAACRRLSIEPYDLVISDLRLPGMDGIALMDRIRVDHPEIHRILMTGDDSFEVEMNAHQAGVHVLVAKPFLGERLAAMVRELLVESDTPNNDTCRLAPVGLNLQCRS